MRMMKMMSYERRMEEIEKMDDEVCVHDLEAIRDYFLEETGGSCPVCLDYAIAVLRVRINEREDAKNG